MQEIRLKNKDGEINPLIFSKGAGEWAEKVYSEGKRFNKNKSSQLRKFYDEFFKLAQRSASYSEKDWKRVILPQIHMMLSRVVYAKGRKLVTDSFVNLIESLISQINTKEDLKVAVNFFEAFIGFYRIYGP